MGIGTGSPAVALDVVGSSGTIAVATSKTDATDKFYRLAGGHYSSSEEGVTLISGNATSSSNNVNIGGGTGALNAATLLRFYTAADTTTTGGTERARIDSSGNLLVGTTSNAFSSRLCVQGAAGLSTPDVTVGIPVNASGNTCFTIARSAATSGYVQLEAFNAGVAGAKIVINGSNTGEVLICGPTDNGAYNLQCNGTGVWGAGAYVNGSDERIKEDIAPIDSGLGVVEKLNPVTYRYKEDWSKDQSIQTGFIAQELLVAMAGKSYVDGVVQQGGSKGYYSVAYQNIIPILTKAIQELKAINDAQAQTIESLTARVAALEQA